MDIFNNFGINLYLTFAEIVNFIIVLLILRRYLYRPILNVLKKRKDEITEGMNKAEEGRKVLENANLEEKKIIKNAHTDANQILKDARDQAAVIMKDAEESAKKQTDRMIRDAKVQIEQETKQAEIQLDKYVSKLSVELLRKSATGVFSENEQDILVQRAIKEFQKKPN